jgi:excisionase family DNA binding protein
MAILSHRQLPPTARDSAIARQSAQHLSRLAGRNLPLTVRVRDADQDRPIELPAGAVTLLMDILDAMAAGRGLALVPENVELTTVQAAQLLNVSRPFLIGLLEARAIPYRKVGRHRRIRVEDVMAYKERTDHDRETVLDKLVADAQEHDMGYRRL